MRLWPQPFLLALVLSAGPAANAQAPAAAPASEAEPSLFALPELSQLETAVADQIRSASRAAESLFLVPAGAGDRSEALGVLARLFDAYGMADFAETFYRAALAQQETFRWLYALAYRLQRTGTEESYRQAEALYRRALQLEPNSLPAYVHLAEILREQNRLDDAEQLLEAVLIAAPEEASSLALLGQIALDRKEYERAIELLQKALEQAPEANRLHYPLALAYRGLGDRDEASQHLGLRGDVGVRPADPWVDELAAVKEGERVHTLTGRMAFRAGRFAEAVDAFRKAVEANPESSTARVNLGTALTSLGQPAEALVQFQHALELEPDNSTALFNVGRLLSSAGRPDQALPFLARSVEIAPKDYEALAVLGQTLAGLGRHDRALERFRAAIGIAYDHEPARVGEATALAALGRYSEAIQSLEATIDVLGRTPPIVYALVRLLAASPEAELRDGERALELATRLYEIQPTTGNAALVAQSHAELGQCDEAAEWQQRVIDTIEGAGQAVDPGYRQALEHYQQSRPCRPPGDWQQGVTP